MPNADPELIDIIWQGPIHVQVQISMAGRLALVVALTSPMVVSLGGLMRGGICQMMQGRGARA